MREIHVSDNRSGQKMIAKRVYLVARARSVSRRLRNAAVRSGTLVKYRSKTATSLFAPLRPYLPRLRQIGLRCPPPLQYPADTCARDSRPNYHRRANVSRMGGNRCGDRLPIPIDLSSFAAEISAGARFNESRVSPFYVAGITRCIPPPSSRPSPARARRRTKLDVHYPRSRGRRATVDFARSIDPESRSNNCNFTLAW